MSLPAADRLPILAVDDRSENLLALEAVLAPLAVDVVAALSGEEALRLLLERDFALILLDVLMPGLDGLETARLIKQREHTRDIPIIFLTAAHYEAGEIVRGYDVGAVDYVIKPFDAELLRSKVSVFAELERSRRALRQSEAFLRSAFDAAPIGKTVLNADWRIVRANAAFARFVGRGQDELAGVPITDLCRPEERTQLAAVLDRSAASGDHGDARSELGLDIQLVTATGLPAWVAPTTSAIAATSPLLLVQWVDVTARRRAEQSRAELLIEQAARSQAEAAAERLRLLEQVTEPIGSRSVKALVDELARRLVRLLDATAAEIRVDDGQTRALYRAGEQEAAADEPPADEHWHEEPLRTAGEPIGLLRVAFPRGRSLPRSDRTLLRDAADRVSVVISRVQLHEQEHRIAVELQRGLLPTRLPEVPGIEIAARYQAAGLGTEVGGDWYDAFALPGERLGVVVGDVTGSGIRAASMMGQLRSVTRAFALGDPDPPSPAEVLMRVHRYHRTLGFEQLFTMVYVVLDPASGVLEWANAGHPPPVLRRDVGDVHLLEEGDSMMLLADVSFRNWHVQLDHGDALVLYTDGLIERRGEPIDAGLDRLSDAVRLGPADPESLCASVLGAAGVEARSDDVTTLVIRLAEGVRSPGAQDGRIQVTIPADLGAATAARRLLEESFGDLLEPGELDRAKLAVSELTTNAVRHGRGSITLRAELSEARLLVEVLDEGPGFEHVPRPPEPERFGGWGLELVAGATSRWGVKTGAPHVWFEIERAGGGAAGVPEAARG